MGLSAKLEKLDDWGSKFPTEHVNIISFRYRPLKASFRSINGYLYIIMNATRSCMVEERGTIRAQSGVSRYEWVIIVYAWGKRA